MIPGPISPRAPVDPGLAQRQLTENGDQPADAGSSFADLLAAMLAPGAPGAQLQAQDSPSEAVFERLDAAEMFNETGLFRGAAPLPSAEAGQGFEGKLAAIATSAASAARSALASNPQADLQASLSPPAADPAPAPGITVTPADHIAAAGGSGAPAAPLSRAAYRAMLAQRGQPVPPAPGVPGSEPGGESAGPVRVPPRTASVVAQLVAAKVGAAAAQVSVQAVEGGINVTARVDKLSREERDRLREEIGALLASHGFAGAQIWLNGEAWPSPQGEKN